MLDTIAVSSPPLSEGVAALVEGQAFSRIGLCNRTGETQYHFQNRPLPGSWSNMIMVKVERERWIATKDPTRRGGKTTRKVPSPPWLRFEASVHKAMIGHNVEGGPEDAYRATVWFVRHVLRGLGVSVEDVPPIDDWEVDRIDWAEAWDLGSWETVRELLASMNNAVYPRRKPRRYGLETLMFPGSSRTLKFYHKGPEFGKHTAKLLKGHLPFADVEKLQAKANRLLRVELGIKKRELERASGQFLVRDLRSFDVAAVHRRELATVLREGESEMRTVRKADDVVTRLSALYGPAKSSALVATWMSLAAWGEERTRSRMTRPTWYRHRKALQDAGVSWTGTDVRILARPVLPDGPLLPWDKRVTGQHPTVEALLAEISPAPAQGAGGAQRVSQESRGLPGAAPSA